MPTFLRGFVEVAVGEGIRARVFGAFVWSALVLTACDGGDPHLDASADAGRDADTPADAGPDGGPDSGPDAGSACEGPPGLFVEGSCELLAPGVRAYHPRFLLWADGAEKERAIYLPPIGGPETQIDTSNPDHWVFPVGTRLYKTFVLDGVRLETRLLEKTELGTGPSAWNMRAFAWNAEQTRATEVSDAAVEELENVLGTEHDIPSVRDGECQHCHSSSLDTVNGFSAIELNHDEDGLTLAVLRDEGRLSDPITDEEATIPGDDVEVAALGYLHANCGSCHRTQPDASCTTPPCCPATDSIARQACATGLHMWVDVGLSSIEQTGTWLTAVGQPNHAFVEPTGTVLCRVHPHDPETSAIPYRMSHRGDSAQMPPLATELQDEVGIAALNAWIEALPAPTGTDVCAPL